MRKFFKRISDENVNNRVGDAGRYMSEEGTPYYAANACHSTIMSIISRISLDLHLIEKMPDIVESYTAVAIAQQRVVKALKELDLQREAAQEQIEKGE